MKVTSSNTLLGTSRFGDGYRVEFYNKKEMVVAKVYQTDKKIGRCILEDLPIAPLTYNTLPSLTRSKIDHLLNKQKKAVESRKAVAKKTDQTNLKAKKILSNSKNVNQDSDEELLGHDSPKSLHVFNKEAFIPVTSMTIACPDQNIKGSTLIEIVHDIIQEKYNEVIDYACEYERELGGAAIPSPTVVNNILSIQAPREWLMSLGGWKGMMPKEEIKEYFFYRFEPQKTLDEKFAGVAIYQNGVVFPIINHRLHLPEKFSINQVDVTGYWEKQNDKWVRIVSGKTDLSYSQILAAIEIIKKQFKLQDFQIALLQLCLLNRSTSIPAELKQQIPGKNQKEIVQFLDYLNGLMFGIEASGLNAALATGLMTLDLIVNKQFDYKTAFKANADGGIYPYACFGNNRGTYSAREKILSHKKQNPTPYSMKSFRKDTSLSPVAVKEAILIKKWLEYKQVLKKNTPYSEQVVLIQSAIEDLIVSYFSR